MSKFSWSLASHRGCPGWIPHWTLWDMDICMAFLQVLLFSRVSINKPLLHIHSSVINII